MNLAFFVWSTPGIDTIMPDSTGNPGINSDVNID